MEQATGKRRNKRMVVLVANSDERQIDRTMMAAWSIRQKHPDAPIAVVTSQPKHKIWRTGLFNVVISSDDAPDATPAECVLMAMRREVFDRAVVLDSHCRLRGDSILPVFGMLKETPICLAAARTADGVRLSSMVYSIERSEPAQAFLEALGEAERRNGGDSNAALQDVVRSRMMRDRVRFGALGAEWIPVPVTGKENLPNLEVRRGDAKRLYAEMLMFAMHRLVSSDMKRAATIYARVALSSRPDLPQLGAARLVEHMRDEFAEKSPKMSPQNREQLQDLLDHAAEEDPAGNLLGIAALHLEMGQLQTAVAVLRMVYTIKFQKPVPVPD